MLNSNKLLDKYQKLSHSGIAFKLKGGARVARGFADLGYEEFYLTNDNNLISIYTATKSAFDAGQKDFFFVVPSFNQLYNQIVTTDGLDFISLEFVNDQWELKVNYLSKEYQYTGVILEEILVDCLIMTKDELKK